VADMNFDSNIFGKYLDVIVAGISAGFVLGFISWGIGYAIYSIIKFFKMA
jgi:hypothetical protein